MSHLKRQKTPKNWPISRKGTAFVVNPLSNLKTGVPVLIILREMLKTAKTRKEVKKAIYEKKILLNGKVINDDKQPAMLFDIITIVPAKKNYRLELKENGKFRVEEIPEKDAGKKIAKVTGKKILKGKKVQLNLSDGRNFLTDLKCNINDSVVIDLKTKKIEKCIGLKEKTKVVVFAGKHSGKKGEILKLKPERKMASVKAGKDKINVLIKQLMGVE